jgi:hypothetical protein
MLFNPQAWYSSRTTARDGFKACYQIRFVEIIGQQVERQRRVLHRLGNNRKQQLRCLSSQPLIDAGRRLGFIKRQAVFGFVGQDQFAGRLVGKGIRKGLGGRKITREADIDKSRNRLVEELDADARLIAGAQHTCCHVHHRDTIGIFPRFRVVGKVDPAKGLQRRL